MIDVGFLDANLIRSFPFKSNLPPDQTIPNWLVVDFRAIVHDGRFDPASHNVYLAWITRFGDRLRFGFRTDAPQLADQELIFERSLSDSTRYQTTWEQSVPLANTLEDRCGCSVELLCDPELSSQVPPCGPELLCNPRFSLDCGPDLLCDDE